jgi:hypothetical protein
VKLTAVSHYESGLTGDKKRSPHEEHSLLTGVVDPAKLVKSHGQPETPQKNSSKKERRGLVELIHSKYLVELSIF